MKKIFKGLDMLAEALREKNGGEPPSDAMMGYFLMGLALGALTQAGESAEDITAMCEQMAGAAAVAERRPDAWRAPWSRN